jgi:uncharacterized protein (DUF983 family)
MLRCPKCQQPGLAKGLDIEEHCPHCGHTMQPDEGDFTGAIVMAYCFLSVILGVLVTLAAIYLDWSLTVHLLVWIPFSIAFLLGTYRNWKGVWVGLLYVVNTSWR